MSEVFVFVPVAVAEKTIGFSIDPVGSATEIVYRTDTCDHGRNMAEPRANILIMGLDPTSNNKKPR